MKKVLAVCAQLLLFVLVFFIGTLLDPFQLRWFVSHPTLTSTRFFVPDGLLLLGALFLVILAIEGAAKRLASAGALTTVAFVLALLVGLFAKFGWATHELL